MQRGGRADRCRCELSHALAPDFIGRRHAGARYSGSFAADSGSLRRHPGLARALLDIAAQEPAHDLRRRRVLLGAQPLEELLLARIDQDGQSCGAIFDGQRVSHEVTIGCARHYNKMHIVAIMKLAHSCKL